LRIRKDVLELTAPIVAEQFLTVSLGVVNAIIASHISKEAVSAIGMVDAINNIMLMLFSSLAVGGTVVVAYFLGKDNIHDANEASAQAISSSLLISLVITLLMWIFRYPIINMLYSSADPEVLKQSYTYFNITLVTYPLIAIMLTACGILRGAGDTKTPMKINVIMNILNIVLSYILVYGISFHNGYINIIIPALKVKGAALGMATARVFGAILILYVMFRGSKVIKLDKKNMLKTDLNIQKSIFGIGIPAGIESLLFNVGKLITQVFIVGMGTTSIAANYVANSISVLLNVPGTAFTIAATTLVGQRMGRGENENARDTLNYVVKLSSLCLLVFYGLSFPFANFLASLYTESQDVINMSALIIRMTSIVTPLFWSFSFVLPAGLKGAGDTKYTLGTSFIGMWIFRITLGYILGVTLKMGVLGIWIGMFTDWVLRGILYYIRLRGNKWMDHSVIKGSKEI